MQRTLLIDHQLSGAIKARASPGAKLPLMLPFNAPLLQAGTGDIRGPCTEGQSNGAPRPPINKACWRCRVWRDFPWQDNWAGL